MSTILVTSLSSSNRIKRELFDGEEYRRYKSNAFRQPLRPVRSPVDVAYFVRRTRCVEKKVEKLKHPGTPASQRGRRNCKSKSVPYIKHSFWERAKLTHKQYVDVLSTPHLQSCGDNVAHRKLKSTTNSSLCSPRLIQMSCPTKRRVLATWKDYEKFLSVEILQRFHDMLHTDQNVDLKVARRYFKLRDRKKKRQQLRKKLRKKRRKNRNRMIWLKKQLNETSCAIINFFSKEPRLDMSYKQLIISDTLLRLLAKVLRRKNPILRYSRNLFNKQLVHMVDKIAVWVDSVFKIVEMQSLEEEDSRPTGDLSSVASSLTEASEPVGDELGEGAEGEEEAVEMEGEEGEGGEEGLGEGEGEGEGEEGIGEVSSLERLIMILTNGTPSYLGGTLEELDNVTRNELLNKIKALNKDYTGKMSPAELLKKILTDWAIHNRPSQVDVSLLKKIEEVAELLAAMLTAEQLYGMIGALGPGIDTPGSALGGPGITDEMDYGEDGEPIPGTVTEVIAPDGSVQLGVVEEDGSIQPVHVTPSGDLIPTVYDKKGKVVDKLFDDKEELLDVTFNKFGVPEPDTYNGPLFDDEKYAHELIYNEKGRIIPLCYDKDGNPIYSAYDQNGNPIFYDKDGKPLSIPPGYEARIIDGKLVILNPKGEILGDYQEFKDMEKEISRQGEMGEDQFIDEDAEEEEGSEEEDRQKIDEKEGEVKEGEEIGGETIYATGSRESMITVIKKHKPSKIYEHSNDTVCCLSLKIWAVWLLEITHNAHNWTKWVSNIIGQIREFAAILRGDVLLPNGQKKVLFREDWNKFVDKMNEDIIAWRQYCRHVNDLTKKIIDKFHGKEVHCCEKCLQDHLIKNVVTAHDTMGALTEALNCAGYWQRCLDEIVQATKKLTEIQAEDSASSDDDETGWSYSASSDEDNACYGKRRKLAPSCTRKRQAESLCSCPCKLKQLFPRDVDTPDEHDSHCDCKQSSPVKVNTPRFCY